MLPGSGEGRQRRGAKDGKTALTSVCVSGSQLSYKV